MMTSPWNPRDINRDGVVDAADDTVVRDHKDESNEEALNGGDVGEVTSIDRRVTNCETDGNASLAVPAHALQPLWARSVGGQSRGLLGWRGRR